MIKYMDVVIVGGGPSGAIAALELARRGYEVLLLDKARHPRKTVGESLLPSVWRYLDLMGLSHIVEREGYLKKAGGVVCWNDALTQISFRDFGYDRPGLHVERDSFDGLLLSAAESAGASVRQGVRAESFKEPSEDGRGEVVVIDEGNERTVVSCRTLIDASGQAAFIARQRDWLRLDPDFRFVSLWGYFLGSSFVSSGGLVRPFEDLKSYLPMTFVSQLEGWGWSWHIPLRETTSVGLNVQVDQYKRDIARHSSLESYFLATCASAKYLDELLSPATLMKGSVSMIRDYSYSIKQVAGPGYFIVGDAAGFVDPIFSLGVVMALYSGHLAAWAADRSLANPKQAHFNLQIFERALSGRRALARAMALPSEKVEVNANAQTYFEFFSHDERELMWAAASMTTRSANIAAASGDRRAKPLKRRELSRLQGA